MIIKFCFENEIHRCSDPPRDFSSLPSFLNSMFRLPMPGQIDLSYVNSQGQTIYLNTEEDYQDLMRNNPTKPVKVVITERKQPVLEEERSPLNGEGSEYEVIPNYREEKMEENPRERDYNDIIEISGDNEQKEALIQEEREQSLQYEQNEERDSLDNVMEGLTQKIADNYIMPQVRSAPTMDATEIKNLVRDALKEEMPLIVAQVREALLRENQVRQQHNVNVPEQVQPRNNLPVSYQAYYSYPYYNYPINRLNSYPGQMPQPPIHMSQPHNSERRDRVVPEAQPQVNQGFRPAPPQANANEEKGPHLLDKVVTALSRPLNKATEMVDNLMQKFEGDPYVYCAEGKYPKSVVDKVAHMKEIFPDDDKKELLEFVQRFPRDAPLDQIVTVYWSKKGSQ